MTTADLILVGGGLANALIALRLNEAQPELKILLLEQDAQLGGNHTWSFHGSDLSNAQRQWMTPLVEHNWAGYEVRFPRRSRTLPGSYHSITSNRLDQVVRTRLGESIRTGVRVSRVRPEKITLADGSVLTARSVIDGRGPTASQHLDVRFQKFVGHIVQLAAPHDLTIPIIMDATQNQADGYRFFYTLPFTDRTVLIEDTRYSDSADLSAAEYGAEISDYARHMGWQIDTVLREESGVLPITLGGDLQDFWDESPAVARSGLRAALFHPATGYSLPQALQLADELAIELTRRNDWQAGDIYRLTRQASERLWRQTGFYRALNRMLFLAAAPQERRHVMERFYGLSDGLIARFYAGTNTPLDKMRILIGKPPVKMSRAFNAVFRYRPAG